MFGMWVYIGGSERTSTFQGKTICSVLGENVCVVWWRKADEWVWVERSYSAARGWNWPVGALESLVEVHEAAEDNRRMGNVLRASVN